MSKKKITLTVTDEFFDNVDKVAKQMGLTRNTLCVSLVAQCIYSMNSVVESANDLVKKSLSDIDIKQ